MYLRPNEFIFPCSRFRLAEEFLGSSDRFKDSYLAPKISSLCVANLRNSQLLRALRALNLDILDHNLLHFAHESIRASLRSRVYLKSMNIGLHQIAHCLIDHFVHLNRRETFELRALDEYEKMRLAVFCTGMTYVLVTVIAYFQAGRLEAFYQPVM